jgi:flagellar assembly factor FliW
MVSYFYLKGELFMKINTKYHGEIEYSDSDIIKIKKGIPGFESLHKFILFNVEDNPYFKVLHSIEDSTVGLIAVNPFEFIKEYEVKLSDSIISELKVSGEEDVLILTTVTLNSDIEKITTNLKAPIIININSGLGEQIILDNDEYGIKYPLIRE